MKALTFLEFFNSQYDVKKAILEHLGIDLGDSEITLDPDYHINWINRQYADIVGQKFEAKMIRELFKDTGYTIETISCMDVNIITIKNGRKKIRECGNVRNIDEFICHFQLAKIELIWKVKR